MRKGDEPVRISLTPVIKAFWSSAVTIDGFGRLRREHRQRGCRAGDPAWCRRLSQQSQAGVSTMLLFSFQTAATGRRRPKR